MNINPSAAASVAGTARAAARGGEADNQASEATRQQSTAEKPGGKAVDSSAVDAGDHADDRYGDGRQTLDTFEKSDSDQEQAESQETAAPPSPPSENGSGEHLDLQA